MRILFILPTLTDSRISRRIAMLKGQRFDVKAVAFERQDGAGSEPPCPTIPIGRVRHGRYIHRIPILLRSLMKVRREIGSADVIYAFNLDMALLGLMANYGLARPVVLETADIREIQVDTGWQGALVRAIDRFATKLCALLVLTSDRYETYYRSWLGVTKDSIVIENKLAPDYVETVGDLDSPVAPDEGKEDKSIRIGWFGMLRDEWTWEVLDCLTRKRHPRFRVVLAGVGMLKDFRGRVDSNSFIEYLGEFAYPDGLRDLYRAVDLVMACYPPHIPSSWSRSNRYYEACLFCKPLIVRRYCADAERVEELSIGLVIEKSEIDSAVEAIGEISESDLRRWQCHMSQLRLDAYSCTNEGRALAEAIVRIANV